jgi:hypothetical protein
MGFNAAAQAPRQRRQAEVDALAGIAFALAIERLVLSELLEEDHRQQVRPSKCETSAFALAASALAVAASASAATAPGTFLSQQCKRTGKVVRKLFGRIAHDRMESYSTPPFQCFCLPADVHQVQDRQRPTAPSPRETSADGAQQT